jgi:hypothetical protein
MADAAMRRAYLLGLLSVEEATRLEEGYFAEDGVFEELLLAEDDLIDEYLDERLSADDLQAFEARLRERPELQARVASRRTLARALRSRQNAGRSLPRVGLARVVLALAAVAAAVFVSVRAFQEKPAAPSPEVASAPAPAPAIAARPDAGISASPVILLLGGAGVRDAGTTTPTARITAEVPALRLRLPMARPIEAPVVVEDVDGKTVWKGVSRTVTDDGRSYAEADVPASSLPAGDYVARFGRETESVFRVQRARGN